MKLALGTVQFGLDYGATNNTGQVDSSEVKKILTFAAENNIDTLDTAIAYGNSEDVIGRISQSQHFNIISKIPPINDQPVDIVKLLQQSCQRLGQTELSAVLFHEANDLLGENTESYVKQLTHAKSIGLCRKIGVSVYTPEQLSSILERFSPDIVQVPANWLDQRFVTNDIKQALTGIEVHVRSIFLQGILLQPLHRISPYFASFSSSLTAIEQSCKQLECSRLTFALAFVHCHPMIDKAVIGCCSEQQLSEIINHYELAAQLAKEKSKEIMNIGKKLASNNRDLIDPSFWQLT